MPQKKKIMRDKRDALEILREAFDPHYAKQHAPPRVAELGLPQKRRVKTAAARTESGNGYREPVEKNEEGLNLAESKNAEKERRRQKRETGGDTYREPIDPEDLTGPKGAQKETQRRNNPLYNAEQREQTDTTGAEQPEKPPEEDLDEAQEAILQKLTTETGPFNTLDVSKISGKPAEQAPSETAPEQPKADAAKPAEPLTKHTLYEKTARSAVEEGFAMKSLRERMKAMENSRARLSPEERRKLDELKARVTKEIEGVKPSVPVEKEVRQKPTERQEPPREKAKLIETPKAEPVPVIRKNPPKPRTKPPETTDTGTKEPPDLDIGGIEQELKKSFETPVTKEAENKERVRPAEREEHIKKLDARLAELEANKSAGTREEHREYGGLKTAHDNNYDIAAIDKKIKEYEQQKNLVGIDVLTLDLLRRARAIMESGKEAAEKKPFTVNKAGDIELDASEFRTLHNVKSEKMPKKTAAKPKKNPELKKKEMPSEKKKPFATSKEDAVELHEDQFETLQGVEKAFAEKFGITPENLAAEGFDKLSPGQKRLVLHNLDQLTRGRIEEEAAAMYKENTRHSKFLGKVFRAVTEGITGKEYKLLSAKKQTEQAIRTGGIAMHGAHLPWLVKMAQETPVTVNEKDGSLEITYINPDEFGPDAKEAAAAYNKAAGEFSAIPLAWSWDTATKNQQKEFTKTKERYTAARNIILEHSAQQSSRRHALQYGLQLDNAVQMNQLVNANPDMEAVLQQIESKKTWKAFAKSVGTSLTEKGLYSSAGYITRWATVTMLGLAAAPAGAGVLKGIRATKQGAEAFREEKKLRRGSGTRKEKGKKAFTEKKEGQKYKKKLDGELLAKNDFVDAEHATERIQHLLGELESGKQITLRSKQLDRLLQYTHAKLEDGYINFGVKNKNTRNQYELLSAISAAHAQLAAVPLRYKSPFENINPRVEKALELHKQKISKEKRTYLVKQFGKGFAIGATFTAGGWCVRHLMEETGFVAKTPEMKAKDISPPRNLPVGEIRSDAAGTDAILPPAKSAPATESAAPATESTPEKPAGTKATAAKPEAAPERMEILAVGARGPEGALIDSFRENTELAKQFGWDGTTDISEWAGAKAHIMWLEHAKEAIKKPALIEQMKKLGYLTGLSKNELDDETILLGRYGEMMHRIQKGSSLSIDQAKKSIDFSALTFLKARA